MSHHESDNKKPIAIPLPQLKEFAAAVANEMQSISGPLPPEMRDRFIVARAALFQRGIFDPVLVRYDSATAPPATNQEIAEQLAKVAESL